jgi:hypothetical protein
VRARACGDRREQSRTPTTHDPARSWRRLRRASDGGAVAHNLAGLAGQRGTRVTLLSSFSDLHRCFTRAGEYPRTAGVAAGTSYAAAGPMCDSRGLLEGVGPLLAVSSDLGRAGGPVFALGVFGPSGLHRTTYTQGGRDTMSAPSACATRPARSA